MKIIISILLFLFFSFTALFQDTVMAFSMHENREIGMHDDDQMMMSDCSGNNTEGKTHNYGCQHDCCYNSSSSHHSLTGTSSIHYQQKIKYYFSYDRVLFSFHVLENRGLLFVTSPPFLEKNIKNYNYSQLVKIIKSNT